MARMTFGGGMADWALTVTEEDLVAPLGAATVTFWNAEVGGTQHTDLQDMTGGAITYVTTSDGTDGRAPGAIPQFRGPESIFEMWASADGGPRQLMTAVDLGAVFGPAKEQLDAHLAGGANPHGTRVDSLLDVDVATDAPADGEALVYDADRGVWVPGEAVGGAGGVSLTGGSVIEIPEGDAVTQPLKIRVPSGNRTFQNAPDSLSVEWNSGTALSPNWRRVGWFNEYGELRTQSSDNSRIAFRVKQRDNAQTGNLTEWTRNDNTILASVGPTGIIRGPNLGQVLSWGLAGTATVGVGGHRQYNMTGVDLVIRGVIVSCGTAGPTGADLIVDVNKGGTTIFTTQANRPRIVAGANASAIVTAMNITTLEAGAYLTVDIDQVGSTVAGSGLVVSVLVY